jgi:histidinol dehydrogenase
LLTREILIESSFPSQRAEEGAKEKGLSAEQIVSDIISEVQNKGDKALFHYTKKLDKANLSSLEVTPKEISAAYEKTDKKLLSALKLAAERINNFHSTCRQKLEIEFLGHGTGRQVRPLNKIGIYVPGGTAAYPSTVLMTAIPARVAEVKEIIMATPPQKDGTIPAPTLVAADIAKVNRIFKLGGAQAIAALAFGTESIPKVDKICGPGNVFVATAKKLVFGTVAIDGIQGPSEIIVVADDTANAAICAADLIAQAEHDSMASAILITTSKQLAEDVNKEVKAQLSRLARKTVAASALNSSGAIVLVDNMNEAIELVNLYAPEHLLLMIRSANSYIEKINNAGCIFINESSPVVLGDYIAGPSHVLPTGGTARFSSPLGVEDFIKTINIVALDDNDQKELGQAAIDIAEAEGLSAHAQAIKIRLQAAERMQNGLT